MVIELKPFGSLLERAARDAADMMLISWCALSCLAWSVLRHLLLHTHFHSMAVKLSLDSAEIHRNGNDSTVPEGGSLGKEHCCERQLHDQAPPLHRSSRSARLSPGLVLLEHYNVFSAPSGSWNYSHSPTESCLVASS